MRNDIIKYRNIIEIMRYTITKMRNDIEKKRNTL
jgi:hypothetical protein